MEKQVIDSFRGEHEPFSNFYIFPMTWKGLEYRSVEHAFQAQKPTDPVWQEKIRNAKDPGEAKKLGRSKKFKLRADWEDVKDGIMEALVTHKFKNSKVLAGELLSTGDALLIEGNTWHDQVWGMVRGRDGKWVGQNRLGKILMKVRSELRSVPV